MAEVELNSTLASLVSASVSLTGLLEERSDQDNVLLEGAQRVNGIREPAKEEDNESISSSSDDDTERPSWNQAGSRPASPPSTPHTTNRENSNASRISNVFMSELVFLLLLYVYKPKLNESHSNTLN